MFAPHSADTWHIKHNVCRYAMFIHKGEQVCSSSSCMKNVTSLHVPQPYMLPCIAFLIGCKEHAQHCLLHFCSAKNADLCHKHACMHVVAAVVSLLCQNAELGHKRACTPFCWVVPVLVSSFFVYWVHTVGQPILSLPITGVRQPREPILVHSHNVCPWHYMRTVYPGATRTSVKL